MIAPTWWPELGMIAIMVATFGLVTTLRRLPEGDGPRLLVRGALLGTATAITIGIYLAATPVVSLWKVWALLICGVIAIHLSRGRSVSPGSVRKILGPILGVGAILTVLVLVLFALIGLVHSGSGSYGSPIQTPPFSPGPRIEGLDLKPSLPTVPSLPKLQ